MGKASSPKRPLLRTVFLGKALPGSGKSAGLVSVFAAAGSHVAATAVRLSGELTPSSRHDFLIVETDRTVYAPGQIVHVRGYVRDFTGGKYVVKQGPKYNIEVIDKNKRRLRRQEVSPSPMGTFSFDCPLPPNDTENSYRVACNDREFSYLAEFQVRPIASDSLHLTLELPKRTYYRGEPIEGRLRALLPMKQPLVGAKIVYSLGRNFHASGTTDAHMGAVRFSIPTADIEDAPFGLLTFQAAIDGRAVSVEEGVVVTTKALAIDMDLNRSLYLANEPFEVRVKTTNATSRPVAEKVSLKLFELKTTLGISHRTARRRTRTYNRQRRHSQADIKNCQGRQIQDCCPPRLDLFFQPS